jgi:uncharacterized protein (TIGR02266 family)
VEGHRKILIVDDAAMFRELNSLFLARFGSVATACDGEEALAIARAVRPDVVVSDLHMPRLDGEALCRAIRADAALKDVPVILTIPGENPEDRARAVRAGADDIVAKPISRIALVDAVNRLLRPNRRASLARVAVETRVRIRDHGAERWGRSRNLSRGGIFVAAEELLPVATEVELEFALPEGQAPLHPTARVVWGRRNGDDEPPGMGLQFLALDRDGTRQIESFVYEHARQLTRPATPAPERIL